MYEMIGTYTMISAIWFMMTGALGIKIVCIRYQLGIRTMVDTVDKRTMTKWLMIP